MLVSLACSVSVLASSSSCECCPWERGQVRGLEGVRVLRSQAAPAGGALMVPRLRDWGTGAENQRRAVAALIMPVCTGRWAPCVPSSGRAQPCQPLKQGAVAHSRLTGPGLPHRVKTRRKQAPETAAGGKEAACTLGPISWVSAEPSVRRGPMWPPTWDGHGHTLEDLDGHRARTGFWSRVPINSVTQSSHMGVACPSALRLTLRSQGPAQPVQLPVDPGPSPPPPPQVSLDPGPTFPSFLSLLPNTGCQGDPTRQIIIANYKVQGSPRHSQLQ